MSCDKTSINGLKDATPEDKRLVQETIEAERKAGIAHPEENMKKREGEK